MGEKNKNLMKRFVAGSLSAVIATSFTNPIETVKNRLQVQGEMNATQRVYSGFFNAFGVIARREGIRAFYKGIAASYSYQIIMNGIRLGFYDPLKHALYGFFGVEKGTLGIHLLAGSLTGMLGACVGTP